MSTVTDINRAFAAEKQGQIAQARAIVERNRADIASYDSGATQAAIDARLADQVARGAIEMVGTDRYKVLTGIDANETFSVQRATRPGEIPLILPETGLDMVDGNAQLYLAGGEGRVPAWHELGNVIPGGVSDIDQVLELGGLNWGVEQRDVRYSFGGELRTMPDQHVNVRDDTGAALGVVGRVYTPIQNREGFEFLQRLVAKGDAIWESAGPLRGGRKTFVSMRLPEDVTVDAGGINDTVQQFVAAINSHDGWSPFQGVVTPWRILCGNTERFAVRDAVTRWAVRHTSGATEQIEEARRFLRLSGKYFERFAAEETTLARLDLQLAEFDELIASLWPLEDDPSKQQVANAVKRADQISEIFATEAGRVGRTAYAAERSVTAYLDRVAPKRALGGSMAAARATAVLEGSADDLKSKAHARLLTLVNR